MRKKNADGFTLLEVMMATVLLAVGSVSIIMVLTSAAAYATRRAEIQKMTQVFEEARAHAQAEVNRFVPKDGRAVPGPQKDAAEGKAAKKADDSDADESELEHSIESQLCSGYSFTIDYTPVAAGSADRGFEATIAVYQNVTRLQTRTIVVASDTISLAEFQTSTTFEQERKGADDSSASESD